MRAWDGINISRSAMFLLLGDPVGNVVDWESTPSSVARGSMRELVVPLLERGGVLQRYL